MGKTCTKCRLYQHITQFRKFVDKGKYEYIKNVCRTCESRISSQWAKDNPKRKQERNRVYFHTDLGKQALRRKTKKFRIKFPKKYKAYNLVVTALRNGTLKKKPCNVCKSNKVHAHHEDYDKPLEVIWLCEICHIYLHRAMIAERSKP